MVIDITTRTPQYHDDARKVKTGVLSLPVISLLAAGYWLLATGY
jgi:hypothetical protein